MRLEAPWRRASVSAAAIVVLILLSAPAALAVDWAIPQETALCAAPQDIPGLGTVCPREDGLFELVGPGGESLGFTHGHDPLPSHAPPRPSYDGPTRAPVCADPVTEPFHNIVIYARAVDDADRYDHMAPRVRHLVERANFLLTESASVAGSTADYRVLCDADGRTRVFEAVLPTPQSEATFQTVLLDLVAQGFADPRTKLWVWYDDTSACTCGGTGHFFGDTRPAISNLHNGNGPTSGSSITAAAYPMLGVTWGYEDVRIMMHENGHTLGAVLTTAPHTTGSGHCTDGADIMCYNDGGPFGWQYNTAACSESMPFDCGNDDYFHPNPADGSFLARSWNLASPVNRFIVGCHEASALAVPGTPATEGPDLDFVTLPVPDACRGHAAAAWVVDEATQNTVFHPVELCWRGADGALLSCSTGPLRPFPLGSKPYAEARAHVPDAPGVTVEIRHDAGHAARVWFTIA